LKCSWRSFDRLGPMVNEGRTMSRNYLLWIGIAVTVIGLFLLVSGAFGPLLLAIAVTVLGIVLIFVSRRQRQ
jgi:hypothetical protein